MAGSGTVFVTVGTTKFDALIEAVDDLAVADELAARGYTSLIMQIGSGSYVPHRIVEKGSNRATLTNGLKVETFDYAPNLDQYMREAALIISHAGSGSLFEAMRHRRPLVAVPNATLMANHQAELAEHLAAMGHCVAAMPDTLLSVLQDLDPAKLRRYEPGDASGIVAAIDKHMGFS